MHAGRAWFSIRAHAVTLRPQGDIERLAKKANHVPEASGDARRESGGPSMIRV